MLAANLPCKHSSHSSLCPVLQDGGEGKGAFLQLKNVENRPMLGASLTVSDTGFCDSMLAEFSCLFVQRFVRL